MSYALLDLEPAPQVPVDGTWSSIQMRKTLDLFDRVRAGSGPLVRVYKPLPTVAFSRREALTQGFKEASDIAVEMGFAPVVRLTGGRAVAYDQNSLVIDVVSADDNSKGSNEAYFLAAANFFSEMLQELGVDARVGEVPGEYCPGKFSVNARGTVKLMGAAQRVLKGARLLSASLPISDAESSREVLSLVNKALNFEWDPKTFVALEDEAALFDNRLVRNFIDQKTIEFATHYHKAEATSISL